MTHIKRELLRSQVRDILESSITYEYADRVSENDAFVDIVQDDIETTSDWENESYYNEDDVRLAVGRAICVYLSELM